MSAIFHSLPAGIRVIERGWLNCNQVVMLAPAGNLLVDSGYGRHAGRTLQAVAEALGGATLERLLNTHCHSDHMGGNRALREHYRCRITIPAGEVGHIVPWSAQSCWSAQMDQYAEEFAFDDTLSAGDEFAGGHLRWQAIAAPGHDMDALMFWSAEAGILITGDALWERGLGFVFPGETGDSADNHSSFMAAALATLDAIEALQPRWIIPGHGAPFQGVSAAIDFARSRLTALAADPVKNARAVVRSLFVFALLDQGGMAIDTVPGYLASVPVYRDLGARFLRQESACLAATLVADLVKVGAIRVAGQRIEPTLRA